MNNKCTIDAVTVTAQISRTHHNGIMVTNGYGAIEFHPTNKPAPLNPQELLELCADMGLHRNGLIQSALCGRDRITVNDEIFDADHIAPYFIH